MHRDAGGADRIPQSADRHIPRVVERRVSSRAQSIDVQRASVGEGNVRAARRVECGELIMAIQRRRATGRCRQCVRLDPARAAFADRRPIQADIAGSANGRQTDSVVDAVGGADLDIAASGDGDIAASGRCIVRARANPPACP